MAAIETGLTAWVPYGTSLKVKTAGAETACPATALDGLEIIPYDRVRLAYRRPQAPIITGLEFRQAYAGYLAGLSPRLWWRMGESSGYCQDSSGNAHHATAQSGTSYNQSGALVGDSDKAMYWSNGYQQTPNHADLQTDYDGDFWLTFWCKFTGATDGMFLVHKWGSEGTPYHFPYRVTTVSSGKLVCDRLDTGGASGSTYTSKVINDGVWHHVVFRKEGSVFATMLDGLYDYTGADNTTTTCTSTHPFTVAQFGGGSGLYVGYLDEVAYGKTPLPSWDQFRQLYYIGSQNPPW